MQGIRFIFYQSFSYEQSYIFLKRVMMLTLCVLEVVAP